MILAKYPAARYWPPHAKPSRPKLKYSAIYRKKKIKHEYRLFLFLKTKLYILKFFLTVKMGYVRLKSGTAGHVLLLTDMNFAYPEQHPTEIAH